MTFFFPSLCRPILVRPMVRRWFLPAIAVIAAAAIAAAVVRLIPVTRDGSTPRRAVVLDATKDKIIDEEYALIAKQYSNGRLPDEVFQQMRADKITNEEYAWMAKHYPDGSLPDEVFHQMRDGDDGWVYSYYFLDTPRGRREVWFYSGIRDK
jgi:hypothetical protein